jgi:hypothetical protein
MQMAPGPMLAGQMPAVQSQFVPGQAAARKPVGTSLAGKYQQHQQQQRTQLQQEKEGDKKNPLKKSLSEQYKERQEQQRQQLMQKQAQKQAQKDAQMRLVREAQVRRKPIPYSPSRP